jgi:hypothetical protein
MASAVSDMASAVSDKASAVSGMASAVPDMAAAGPSQATSSACIAGQYYIYCAIVRRVLSVLFGDRVVCALLQVFQKELVHAVKKMLQPGGMWARVLDFGWILGNVTPI